MRILITSGTGFIGFAVVRHVNENTDHADQDVFHRNFKKHRSEAVMHLAARFGVIMPEWYHATELCFDEMLELR